MQTYGVFLRRAGDSDDSDQAAPTEFVELECETRHLAARGAEHSLPGFHAYAVMTRWAVVGKCEICHAVLFEGERSRPGRRGPRCFEC